MNHKKTLVFILATLTATATITFFKNANDIRETNALSNRDIITANLTDAQVNAYYTGVSGLSGTALKTELNDIIKGHTSFSYDSETPYIMKITDRDWTLSPLGTTTNYSFSDDPYMNLMYGGYNGVEGTAYKWSADHSAIWNKEHTWAKSHGNFGETAPAGTDLHHLRAADQGLNNYHSNYDFGNVGSGSVSRPDERGNPNMGYNGTPVGFSSGTVFEPHDMYKGDVARMIFYMATRYITYSSTGNPKLRLVEYLTGTVTSSASVYGEMGLLSHYLEWNELDPVDAYEIHRNNLIDRNFQHNRNPYIDHPEWARIVYDADYSGSGATIASETSSVGTNPAWQTSASPLASISVNAEGAKTSYALNETLNTSGLVVTAHYEDMTSRAVTGFTTSPTHGSVLSTSGNTTITVSYTEESVTKTTSYSVAVSESERVLQNIELDTASVDKNFVFGDAFSSSGLIVTAYYSDSTSEAVEDYYVAEPDMLSIGTQEVVVSYLGKTASYDIALTNQGAVMGTGDPITGDLYTSPTASGGAIATWSGSGLGGAYADGAAKLDTSGDYMYNTAIWSGSTATNIVSMEVTVSFKLNTGGAGATELNKVTVYALNGNLSTVVGSTYLTGVYTTSQAEYTYDFTSFVGSPVTITGLMVEYTTKSWGNLGVYYIEATPTYAGDPLFTADDQAISYANFFLLETSSYCESLDGGSVDWVY
ncbi:MAG: endonuclease, partial [Bacilli bacterium]